MAVKTMNSWASGARKLFSRRTILLFLVLSATCLPALVAAEVIGRVADLYPLAAHNNPYFIPSLASLLYFITPLVALSSFCLFLFPGLLLVMAFDDLDNFLEWAVKGFAVSIALTFILGTGAKMFLGVPLQRPVLLFAWVAVGFLAWIVTIYRGQLGGRRSVESINLDLKRLFWPAVIALTGLIALTPKIHWENFNLDGIEAFEFGRSLTNHLLPHWEIQDGIFGFYQNFVLFAYPNHWFINLFGPYEASSRLPFILYLALLFALLVLLIELERDKFFTFQEEAVLALGLALFTVVQTYNSNYEPFFADLAEMAATDTLWIVSFLAACYFLWKGDYGWFWAYGLMTYLASPGGLLLLGALFIGTFLVRQPARPAQLKSLFAMLLVVTTLGVFDEVLYNRVWLGGVNDQFSGLNMIRRLYPPTFTQFARFNAILFPSGILPALSLLFVHRQDSQSKILTIVTVISFGLLYIQVWASLHQYTPVMVLPLVVFWRLYSRQNIHIQRWMLAGITLTTGLCIYLSLPTHFAVNLAVREIGEATEYKIGHYDTAYEQALSAGWSLYALFPEDYRMLYPEQPWGADPASWIYYAARRKPAGTPVNYIIQPSTDPVPSASQVLTKDGVSIYVQDQATWKRHQNRDLPQVVQSPLYEPIYRQTFQFFREYVVSHEQEELSTSDRSGTR